MANKNKKPNHSSRHKNTAGLVLVVVILAVAAAAASFFVAKLITEQNRNNENSSNTSNSDANQTSQANQSSDNSGSSSDNQTKKVEPNPQTPPQYEGENPNNLETLTGAVSYIGASDNAFSVRIAIDQSISGSCEFTIKNPNGVVYTDTVSTDAGPTSTFCIYDASVPLVSGEWTASVKVTSSDGRTGTITGDARI